MHKVESEWHYPIMTKYGYVSNTPSGKGFVRYYDYTNPETGHSINLTHGYSRDYWTDKTTDEEGYPRSLENHLKNKSRV